MNVSLIENVKKQAAKPLLRQAKTSDIPDMTQLIADLFRIEADFEANAPRQQRGLELLLHQPSARVWVAEMTDHTIAGMLSLQEVISTAEGGPAGIIEDLVVKEAYRRQGIGTRLVAKATRYARARGISRIHLLADVHNVPALIFYRSLGWQQTNLVALRSRIRA